ncbi:MAG: HAMP domain-containing histidine kinase [Deltaproteobacteria bacterium]|nr:HAMP domain-containing histidine kinase [Deltaproteobacteria bacterium]
MYRSGLKNDPGREVRSRDGERTAEAFRKDVSVSPEEEIRELREQVRIRTEFFDTLSHELRTPLTAIKAYTDLLLLYREEKEEIQVEFLRVIADESERMNALINDYLDLSKMENRRSVQLRKEDVDPVEVVDYFLTVFSGAMVRKKIEVLKSYAPDLPYVSADKQRLGQVLSNLIGNAVKFTPEGGKIRAEVKTDPCNRLGCREEKPWVIVSIEDSGPGIPEEARDRVFEKFYQLSSVTKEGTGLGLPIAREIVELHGGEISVETGSLGGCAMVFRLPALSCSGVTSRPRQCLSRRQDRARS